MGKGGNSAPAPSTQTVRQETTIPEYFRPYLERTLQRGEDISNLPYQQYQGERIAQFQPMQQQAFNMAQQNIGAYQGDLTNARNYAQGAGRTLQDIDISTYMNPYQQNVIDIAKREAVRQDDIARNARSAQAVGAGAFGGSRQAIMEAEANRNLQQRLGDIQTTGSQQAYDRAVASFGQDRAAQAQASGLSSALAAGTQNLARQDVGLLQSMGGQQQAQQQTVLDQAYKDFLAQRDAPKSELEWYSGILRGYQPQPNRNEVTTSQAPAPSLLGQLGSLGAAGVGLAQFTKGFKKGGAVKSALPPAKYADGGEVYNPIDSLIGLAQTPAQRAYAYAREYPEMFDVTHQFNPQDDYYNTSTVLPRSEADRLSPKHYLRPIPIKWKQGKDIGDHMSELAKSRKETPFNAGAKALPDIKVQTPNERMEIDSPEVGAFITTMGEAAPLPATREFPSLFKPSSGRAWLSAEERDKGIRPIAPTNSMLPPPPAYKKAEEGSTEPEEFENPYGPDSVTPPTEADLKEWAAGSRLPGSPAKATPKARPPLGAGAQKPSTARRSVQDESALPAAEAMPELKQEVLGPKVETPADIKQAQKEGWSNEDIGLALMAAGFAGLKSQSPTWSGALGAAGEAGVGKLAEIKKGKREDRKLDTETRLTERKLATEERKAAAEEAYRKDWARLKEQENAILEKYRMGLLDDKDLDREVKKLQVKAQALGIQATAEARQGALEERAIANDQKILDAMIKRFTAKRKVQDPLTGTEVEEGVTDWDAVGRAFMQMRPDSPLTAPFKSGTMGAQTPKYKGSFDQSGVKAYIK